MDFLKVDDLIGLLEFVLAVSIASERFVTLLKTMIPWLSEESIDPAGSLDLTKDRYKSLTLQFLSLAVSILTAYIALEGKDEQKYFWLVGAMASVGSAFWTGLLGYITSARDIKKSEATEKRLDVAAKAKSIAGNAKTFTGPS